MVGAGTERMHSTPAAVGVSEKLHGSRLEGYVLMLGPIFYPERCIRGRRQRVSLARVTENCGEEGVVVADNQDITIFQGTEVPVLIQDAMLWMLPEDVTGMKRLRRCGMHIPQEACTAAHARYCMCTTLTRIDRNSGCKEWARYIFRVASPI